MNQGKLKINDILLVKDGAAIGKTRKKNRGQLFVLICLSEALCLQGFRPPSGMP